MASNTMPAASSSAWISTNSCPIVPIEWVSFTSKGQLLVGVLSSHAVSRPNLEWLTLMKAIYLVPACLLLMTSASLAQSVPKFAATCVPVTSGAAQQVCVSSNGKSLSSRYMFRGTTDTTATHTNCSMQGPTIMCTGGAWQTATGTKGAQTNMFAVQTNGGKPVSAYWQ
jgi:hypothetical protein